MEVEASKLVCIPLVLPGKSPVGRDYVAGIASEVRFHKESDRYTWIKDSFFCFLFDFFIT